MGLIIIILINKKFNNLNKSILLLVTNIIDNKLQNKIYN